LGRKERSRWFAGSTRDTSQRRRSEEALRRADRRKDEFLAMLAHELRNPLAALANAALMLDSENAADRSWAANVIQRQNAQLTHLIDDLLDVSRINAGKIRLRKETVDVATILNRARDSARPLIIDRGHELITQYEPGTLWIHADPTRLEQIVLNLLTNAAKYTPEGGLIKLTAESADGEVLITVRDNGMGIAPQLLPEMFQLFAQGERSIARSEGGLGSG
jgi:signal transduction histidine kinase